MKVLILAGGLGSRICEKTCVMPKPMVEIGGKPILWHIMKTYSYYGFNDFLILLGYKGHMIKAYFADYYMQHADVSFNFETNETTLLNNRAEPWNVTLLDTGQNTMTGGRIRRVKKFVNNETFMITYGDGVSDINIRKLLKFHHNHGKTLTMTSVQPEGRFGALITDDNDQVLEFKEKPLGDGKWINGGFFVCQPDVFDYLEDDSTIFEKEPLENLTKAGESFAYKHTGFWKPMDTMRDRNELNALIDSGAAPWMKWEEKVYQNRLHIRVS